MEQGAHRRLGGAGLSYPRKPTAGKSRFALWARRSSSLLRSRHRNRGTAVTVRSAPPPAPTRRPIVTPRSVTRFAILSVSAPSTSDTARLLARLLQIARRRDDEEVVGGERASQNDDGDLEQRRTASVQRMTPGFGGRKARETRDRCSSVEVISWDSDEYALLSPASRWRLGNLVAVGRRDAEKSTRRATRGRWPRCDQVLLTHLSAFPVLSASMRGRASPPSAIRTSAPSLT